MRQVNQTGTQGSSPIVGLVLTYQTHWMAISPVSSNPNSPPPLFLVAVGTRILAIQGVCQINAVDLLVGWSGNLNKTEIWKRTQPWLLHPTASVQGRLDSTHGHESFANGLLSISPMYDDCWIKEVCTVYYWNHWGSRPPILGQNPIDKTPKPKTPLQKILSPNPKHKNQWHFIHKRFVNDIMTGQPDHQQSLYCNKMQSTQSFVYTAVHCRAQLY